MGMLIEGQWSDEDLRRVDPKGEFKRAESPFRNWVGDESGQFPAELDRYHLFINSGCPWAYRTLLYRSLKEAEHVFSVSFTEPAAGPEGWTFGQAPDALLGAKHIHDVYTAADTGFTGRCTVPVLWDKQQRTIVNNESSEIIRMMNSAFDALPGVRADLDYYPADLAEEIDALNETIYENVNNGVYRVGFAGTQSAYDAAFDRLFENLDQLDTRLGSQRFLCGERVTEADWRLFATLIRFDMAYHGQFKCNLRRIADYPNLWPYTRDLYQHPGVAETVDFEAIKGIYYGSRPPRILPKGPALDFDAPHHRA